MSLLLFGTAGVPLSASDRTTESGIRRVKELGLGCMEIEFVRGVNIESDRASKIKELSEKEGVVLTVHAPYFINLASVEPQKVFASKQRIIESARIGNIMGAKSLTFHPAFYIGKTQTETYDVVKKWLTEIIADIGKEKLEIKISPETTGKPSQFGNLEETLKLVQEVSKLRLCVDFAHLCARNNGELNSYEKFDNVLKTIKSQLPGEALNELHIHVSGIHYGTKGEIKHLTLEDKDSKFKYKELLQALKENKVGGYLICESPALEEDALLLKSVYEKI
ncbi:MAG: TIM barrel protein [bacterium]